MSLLQGSSNFNINNSDINQIYGDAIIIRFGDGQFTEAQRSLICEHIANLATLPDIGRDLNKNILIQSIRDLPRAEAVFDDYQTKKKSGPCFEGTRVALLREMADWVIGTDESRMYVLSGLAGIGKSTVAYTIASRAADLNLLGASFFFSRDESDRKNAKRFFTTIVYQLCVYNEAFTKAVGDVLQTRRGSAAITKGPLEQLQALILEPLRSIVQLWARPILIVVDALDECDEEDALSVLTGLSKLVQTLPSFKVILTTRPQPHLDHFFDSHDSHKIFRLQDIEDKVVDGDIRLYLKHCLSLEQVQKRLPTRRWCANDEEIDSLVRAAGRLFIIASTVIRIILNKAFSPAVQLQKLLGSFAQDRMPFKDLNEFYTIILRNVVPVGCDDDMVNCYKSVIGAVIFVQHPLPVTTLAHLIGIDVDDIRAVLVNLQSVILLGDDDTPQIYHKSFPDFITDSELCQDNNICIDPVIRNVWITIRCFQIMEEYLRYNISGLGTPARFMRNEVGLANDNITKEQLKRNIPQQLRYACVYWANHLALGSIEDVNVMKELEQFADKHMLHWFEALSLIRKLDSAHRAIRVVLEVLKPTPSDLHQLLSDGLRFISKFYATIERSALHTYYSALPCTPTDSLFYHRYIKEAAHNVCDIEGGPEKWDALIANLSHNSHKGGVNDIKFSPDSTMFVSLSKRMLKIWDAASGTPISTISGGQFAIANDFSTVASFESNRIILYDVNGSERGATFTTSAEILRVAISSGSTQLAAILSDKTFLLWDIGNGELIISYQDRERASQRACVRLEFSATGARLAHPSPDGGCVHLRNGIDGSLVANLDCGPVLRRFAFSAGGSQIATLSLLDLKLWNCEDGRSIGITRIVQKDSYRLALAISANGSLLATGYDKVTVWSQSSGNCLLCIEVLNLDCRSIRTMAFALDDTLAISSEDGIKLYNPKRRSFISTLSFSHSIALAFSPNCTRLATGNGDGTIYLWDIQGIETTVSSSNKQCRVTALALSRDSSRVACGFHDGAVELWETGGLAKQPIATDKRRQWQIMKLKWSPDGRQFVSGSRESIDLWDGESGLHRGALQGPRAFFFKLPCAMKVSNTVLAIARDDGLFLWDLKTLRHIRTFNGFFKACLSFSANGVLLAAVGKVASEDSASDDCLTFNDNPFNDYLTFNGNPTFDGHFNSDDVTNQTIIVNVTKCTIISMFDTDSCKMAFLPDNSQLVVRQHDADNDDVGDILTFNLEDQKLRRTPKFEHFVQLHNVPLCLGVPVSINYRNQQYCHEASHSCHDVPVLWFPRELDVHVTTMERSMIALGCANGRIILLRLHTTPLAG